ncbi:hypothetical protein ONZ51_g11431 [Trametes cubensis]|uniref:DUF4218 domain-containing protein n=1 Tax=Trametes cubensis TaxID=1111947 RepID=A0AAD7TI73_9APHY|nr:hypothetical protein ONZ51_g11431 [Trametes cubensis]
MPTSLEDPPAPVDNSTRAAQTFIEVQNWVESTRVHLASLREIGDRDVDASLAALLCKINDEYVRLADIHRNLWEVEKISAGLYGLSSEPDCGPLLFDSTRSHLSLASIEPFVLAALIMTCMLHAVHSVNHLDSHYVLATLRVLLFGAFMFCNKARQSSITPSQQAILQSMPVDVRTVLKRLGIDPDFVRYACCPRCFQTYAPHPSRPDDSYPHNCDFSETDKPKCGQPLVVRKVLAPSRKGDAPRVVYSPIKPMPYRSFSSWLASLFSRPELEPILVDSWDRAAPQTSTWTDIFHSPMIRNFIGPLGQLFSKQPAGSCHLVFSLFIDWFNPFGNKKAGKSHSVGVIYLACLNLPPHLRFRPENIYLAAIIPGPKEPSLHQLNHLMRPLVNELMTFWTRGLYLKRTALRFFGLLLRIAVIPLVCDLPALRKTAGFAGHSSKHFCSFCRLRKQHINDLCRPWPTRSADEHRQLADEWLKASSEAERNAVFEEHGIRWSELLRLPYWDPLRFPVVDAMHCLFLGNLRHHCRDVWGIDVKDKSTSQKVKPHTPDEQRLWLNRLAAALQKKSRSALSGIRKGYLAAVAQVNDIVPEARLTKKDYIASLLKWAELNPMDSLVLPPVLEEDTTDFHVADRPYDISKFRVLTQDVIDAVRADIANIILPSWMERPPRNFGSAAHGKLKADQWRTVCTVNLTITLTRLWGVASATQRQHLLLNNFLHLVIAVDLATRRSMTKERAAAFDDHMLQYLQGLRELFSHELVPNHHLSLHLAACLMMFGPVHGWWGFPFERYNGILQSMNINNLPEDIPFTFMRGFYCGAELRGLMGSIQWPDHDAYKDMVAAYNAAFSEKIRGTRVSDMAASAFGLANVTYDVKQQVGLSRERYDGLLRYMPPTFTSFYAGSDDSRPRLAPYVQHVRKALHSGVLFATRAHSARDSYVLVKSVSQGHTSLRAGQISDIFLHSRLEDGKSVVSTFVVVDMFVELSSDDAAYDPFRTYPELNTRLCYNRSDSQIVVPLEDLSCHFAALVYTPTELDKEVDHRLQSTSPVAYAAHPLPALLPPPLCLFDHARRLVSRIDHEVQAPTVLTSKHALKSKRFTLQVQACIAWTARAIYSRSKRSYIHATLPLPYHITDPHHNYSHHRHAPRPSSHHRHTRHCMQHSMIRQERRAELFNARLRVVAQTGLERHTLLFDRLTADNMSDDETDQPAYHWPTTYRIVESKWQSQELKTFLRGLDALYRQGWARSRTRVRLSNSNLDGAKPRIRIPQEGGPEADGVPPIGLWRNCYDEGWLRGLAAEQRNALDIVEEDYEFSLHCAAAVVPKYSFVTCYEAPGQGL